jgi:hypothetical protein
LAVFALALIEAVNQDDVRKAPESAPVFFICLKGSTIRAAAWASNDWVKIRRSFSILVLINDFNAAQFVPNW